jgi:DNA-binding transcriptional MerR regulator
MNAGSWTLSDLTARTARALEGAAQQNGQVSEQPNARTIRYYTTLGLLDRPTLVGRTAMYGVRHLRQLVAIKRLQADGHPLVEVQRRLLGLDDASLAALAAVPDAVLEQLEASAEAPLVDDNAALHAPSRRARAFWADAPAAPVSTPQTIGLGAALHLQDGVTLAFPAVRDVDEADLEALRAALEPVVDLLRARGLVKPEPQQKRMEP